MLALISFLIAFVTLIFAQLVEDRAAGCLGLIGVAALVVGLCSIALSASRVVSLCPPGYQCLPQHLEDLRDGLVFRRHFVDHLEHRYPLGQPVQFGVQFVLHGDEPDLVECGQRLAGLHHHVDMAHRLEPGTDAGLRLAYAVRGCSHATVLAREQEHHSVRLARFRRQIGRAHV